METEPQELKRNVGRPKTRIADQVEQNAAPEPTREVARPTVRVSVSGRNGEMLSRSRTANGDPFEFDRRIIPDGWDYQWNQYTVFGEKQVSAQLTMYQNGWRPVPAERHPGVFMPSDYKGQVIREGLILEERPMALTQEARTEERMKAQAQQRDAAAAIGLSGRLPGGFSDDARYRGAGTHVRTSIGPAPDAPRPQLDIAND